MSDTIRRLNTALEGRYRVESVVGEGGMATVYAAEDLRHRRRVALKVLKPELAAVVGAERFLAEIRTTANLQHPHILPLFDSGEAEDSLFYVMPYVEGESLRERLEREGQLPVGEAVAIAAKVAGALHAAHERGVIHRDVKPANILLADGEPLVADFGIALAVHEGGGGRLTETGLSLGTPHYMSPEQASGDARVGPASDIWALGCVLHEMLAGEPPFEGNSAQAVLARILTGRPTRTSAARATVPRNVDAAIAQSLEGIPADRFRSAAEFARALGNPGFRGPGGRPTQADEVRRWRRVALGALGGVAALALVALSGWLLGDRGAARPVVRSSLEPPPGQAFLPYSGFELSPDGRRIAFVAMGDDAVRRLWVQDLDAATATPLAGTEGAAYPFWSPDGRHLGFFAGDDFKRIPAAGGAARVLYAPNPEPKGGAWGPDGRILFVPDYRTGLFEIDEDGGEARPVTQLDESAGELSHRHPRFAADGETILFLVQTHEHGAADDRSRIEVLEPDGTRREILRVNSSFALTPSGSLVHWRDGSLWAVDLDRSSWRPAGEPELLVEGVGFNVNEWALFSASAEGTLVHHVGDRVAWRLEWRDDVGRTVAVLGEDADFSDPELTVQGDRVTYLHENSVWVLDLARGTRTRITFEDVDHYSPTWSPDGEWIAYSANRDPLAGANLYRRRSSGMGERELLREGAGGEPTKDLHWSPDGRHIAFEEGGDLFLLDLESGEARPLDDGPGFASWTRFSPDGRHLAYNSDATGRPEVYVLTVVGEPRRGQVSREGGAGPVWSAAGDALYFLSAGAQIRRVRVGEDLALGPPETVFDVGQPFNFDVGPDGRFLLSTPADPEAARSLRLTQNWPGLLGR